MNWAGSAAIDSAVLAAILALSSTASAFSYPKTADIVVDRKGFKIHLRWNIAPGFATNDAAEIEVRIADKCFAQPPGGKDNSPLTGMVVTLDGFPEATKPYRDVWNYRVPTDGKEAYGDVWIGCGSGVLATGAALYHKEIGVADSDGNFAIGLRRPDLLKADTDYYITYKFDKEAPCTAAPAASRVGIHIQTFRNTCTPIMPKLKIKWFPTDCPFFLGGKPALCAEAAERTPEYSTVDSLFERICAPTDAYAFAPSAGMKAMGVCVDKDGDKWFRDTDPSSGLRMFGSSALDCDDSDGAIHPAATEICNDVRDNNCDGLTDCLDASCVIYPTCKPSSCGDGVCSTPSETCATCPKDCCLGTPDLLLPADAVTVRAGEPVSFSWGPVAKAKRYRHLLTSDGTLASGTPKDDLPDGILSWTTSTLPVGSWYWSVGAIGHDEKALWSAYAKPPRRITIRPWINLTYPVGGETWYRGSDYWAKWISGGIPIANKVRVEVRLPGYAPFWRLATDSGAEFGLDAKHKLTVHPDWPLRFDYKICVVHPAAGVENCSGLVRVEKPDPCASKADGHYCGGSLLGYSGKSSDKVFCKAGTVSSTDSCGADTSCMTSSCYGGACVTKYLDGVLCGSGLKCKSGKCVDLCDGKFCPECQYCSDGACLGKTDGTGCSAGKCKSGSCCTSKCTDKCGGVFDGCVGTCSDPCAGAKHCSVGSCVADVCTKGTHFCAGSDSTGWERRLCNSDGSGWTGVESCGFGCDATSGTCKPCTETCSGKCAPTKACGSSCPMRDCTGKCGDAPDGCGGACKSCPAGYTCVGTGCVASTDSGVSVDSGMADSVSIGDTGSLADSSVPSDSGPPVDSDAAADTADSTLADSTVVDSSPPDSSVGVDTTVDTDTGASDTAPDDGVIDAGPTCPKAVEDGTWMICVTPSGRMYFRTSDIVDPATMKVIPDADIAAGNWTIRGWLLSPPSEKTPLSLKLWKSSSAYSVSYIDLWSDVPAGLCPIWNPTGSQRHPSRLGVPFKASNPPGPPIDKRWGEIGDAIWPRPKQPGIYDVLPEHTGIVPPWRTLAVSRYSDGWKPSATDACTNMYGIGCVPTKSGLRDICKP